MDIKRISIIAGLVCSFSYAEDLFKVENLYLEPCDSATTNCIAYSLHESNVADSYSRYDDAEIPENVLSMSYWLSYHFLNYKMRDKPAADLEGLADGPLKVFGIPICKYSAKRCMLVVFRKSLFEEPLKFIVYKFYKDTDESIGNAFSFALYFDIVKGDVEMGPLRKFNYKKAFNEGIKNSLFYMLDEAEESQQWNAITEMKANHQWNDE